MLRLLLAASNFLFFFCLAIMPSGAQELHLDHFSLAEGLSNSGVRDLHQDKYGFLWIATEHGLNRYDGYEITVFRHHPTDTSSICANYISGICESPEGDIWVIMAAGGVSRFDRSTETFDFYAADHTDALAPHNFARRVFFDDLGHTWIATAEGIHLVDEASRTYSPISFSNSTLQNNFTILTILNTHEGDILMGTDRGLFRFDPATYQLSSFYILQGDTLAPFQHQTTRLVEGDDHRLWIGTNGWGLLATTDVDSILSHPLPNDQGGRLSGLGKDESGSIWACFWEKGLFIKSPKAEAFIRLDDSLHLPPRKRYAFMDELGRAWVLAPDNHFTYIVPNPLKTSQLTLDREGYSNVQMLSPTSIASGKYGTVWIGTTGDGFYQLRPSRQKFTHFKKWESDRPGNNHVMAILRDRKNRLWIGTGCGVRYFDPLSEQFKVLETSDHLQWRFIRGLMEDRHSRLWVAHTEGITILGPDRQVLNSLSLGPENREALLSGNIWQVYEDRSGNIWACTDRGLHRWIDSLQTFRHYTHSPDNPNSFSSTHFRCIYQDHEGVYWVGNIVGKMNKMTWDSAADTMSIARFGFSTDNRMTVNAIYEDSQERLWVGSYSRGLLQVNKQSLEMTRPLGADRSPIPNIAGIVEDSAHNLWISSNDGLYRYCPSNNHLKRFDMGDGLQNNEFNIGAFHKDNYGKLYFGGINGLNCFFPSEIQNDPPTPSPLLTTFTVLGKRMDLPYPLTQAPPICLSYQENFFSIEFVSLGFNHRLRTRYAYRLRGLESQWIPAGQDRKVTYTNLPPGAYTFEVKAANHDGEWTAKKAILPIHIEPPFWQTAWFSVLLGCCLIGMILLAHHLRLRAKIHKIEQIQQVRQKAAADFHDEMGHKLTRISLLTEVTERKPSLSQIDLADYFRKVKDNTGALYHTMRDFLWALDPERDSVFELAVLLKDFGDELFDRSGIDFRISGLEDALQGTALSMDWKRHLALIFKEAMHNTLKYSKGENVWLSFSLEDSHLSIKLADDGQGFDLQQQSKGYGLRNMRARAEQLGSQLEIASRPAGGTVIAFRGLIT